jgi:hypothetical protein
MATTMTSAAETREGRLQATAVRSITNSREEANVRRFSSNELMPNGQGARGSSW